MVLQKYNTLFKKFKAIICIFCLFPNFVILAFFKIYCNNFAMNACLDDFLAFVCCYFLQIKIDHLSNACYISMKDENLVGQYM